jgi:hypothetical protein
VATTVVGPKYPQRIESTLEKEAQERQEKIPHLEAFLEGIQNSKRGLQARRSDPSSNLTEQEYTSRLAGYNEKYGQFDLQVKALRRAERVKQETKETYTRSGDTVYTNALRVQSKSGKNRLYLGNRQEVAAFAQSEAKKKRILDAGVWTWDINFAWLEGGMNAKACFKLKSELPDSVKQAIQQASRNRVSTITARQFKDLCESSEPAPGKLHSDLWHSGENRLTWYALEIYTLLESGYRFRWADKQDGDRPGIRFYLEKPA